MSKKKKKIEPLFRHKSSSLLCCISLSLSASTLRGGNPISAETHRRDGGGGPGETKTGGGGRKKNNGFDEAEDAEDEDEGHPRRMVGPFARRFRGTKLEFAFSLCFVVVQNDFARGFF